MLEVHDYFISMDNNPGKLIIFLLKTQITIIVYWRKDKYDQEIRHIGK